MSKNLCPFSLILLFIFLTKIYINTLIIITIINPMLGIKIEDIDMKTVNISSIKEKKGFNNPPENVVKNALNKTVET